MRRQALSFHDFNPNYRSPHIEPAFGNDGATDFPSDEVCRRLDEEPGDVQADNKQPDIAQVLSLFLEWQVDIRAKDARGLSPIATRTLACVWVVNPSLLGNAPAHMVAKSFGISFQKFSTHAAEFSRRFGIRNQFQSHDAKNKRTAPKPEVSHNVTTN